MVNRFRDLGLEAGAKARGRFKEFLHLVGKKAFYLFHRFGLEFRVIKAQALDEVVCRVVSLLDEVAVVKVKALVKFNLEDICLAEHLERETEAIFGYFFGLRSEHGLKPSETSVTNSVDHLLHHFVDFFIRFHF